MKRTISLEKVRDVRLLGAVKDNRYKYSKYKPIFGGDTEEYGTLKEAGISYNKERLHEFNRFIHNGHIYEQASVTIIYEDHHSIKFHFKDYETADEFYKAILEKLPGAHLNCQF